MKNKKSNQIIPIILAIFCYIGNVKSQSTSTGFLLPGTPNTPQVGIQNYLGWAAGTGFSLTIKNEDALPINFHTNTGAVGFGNIRQTIMGNYGASGGLIGMGDMGTTFITFQPQNLLHLHRTGNTSFWQQFTNDNTGTTNNSGTLIGLEYDPVRGVSDFYFRNYLNDGRFVFMTTDATGQQHTRMNIQKQTLMGQEVTRVKIIEDELHFPNSNYLINPPMALLHLGHNWVYNQEGIVCGWM
ncbi:MAG: hypothetical protein ABIT08_00830 [Bacteroidia bacterium]